MERTEVTECKPRLEGPHLRTEPSPLLYMENSFGLFATLPLPLFPALLFTLPPEGDDYYRTD